MPISPSNTAQADGAARFPADRHRNTGVLAEVLALPARHVTELPLETRFILEGHGFAHELVWTTQAAARSSGRQLVFAASEVQALVTAVQAERLWSSDVKGYCLRKLHDPSFEVTTGLALGGAQPDTKSAAFWQIERSHIVHDPRAFTPDRAGIDRLIGVEHQPDRIRPAGAAGKDHQAEA